jgi:hypothetical protein
LQAGAHRVEAVDLEKPDGSESCYRGEQQRRGPWCPGLGCDEQPPESDHEDEEGESGLGVDGSRVGKVDQSHSECGEGRSQDDREAFGSTGH